jgi:hypothetical protein
MPDDRDWILGNDLTSGLTYYITKNKATTANLATDWEIHGQKSGTNITPGQAFTIEWGFGQVLPLKKDFSRLLQLGLVGYDQWQVSKSSGTLTLGVSRFLRAAFLSTQCMRLVYRPITCPSIEPL